MFLDSFRASAGLVVGVIPFASDGDQNVSGGDALKLVLVFVVIFLDVRIADEGGEHFVEESTGQSVFAHQLHLFFEFGSLIHSLFGGFAGENLELDQVFGHAPFLRAAGHHLHFGRKLSDEIIEIGGGHFVVADAQNDFIRIDGRLTGRRGERLIRGRLLLCEKGRADDHGAAGDGDIGV